MVFKNFAYSVLRQFPCDGSVAKPAGLRSKDHHEAHQEHEGKRDPWATKILSQRRRDAELEHLLKQ
ncbi:MAG: hypothetical protein EA353_12790 [Puniceicoccaceae bacterium]|nr:MAG: hypothetical protein EA353_12790 [Puniceicoccaceae bacterium]